MASKILQYVTRTAAAALILAAGLASSAYARPLPGVRGARASRGFQLFAGSPQINYTVNRAQCNLNNNGENCVDPTGSPVAENGFWPKGTGDNYIFNSGLQIAGFVPLSLKSAQFPWGGDTVGAFFFDPRGDQHHGDPLTNFFDAKSSDDLANWPSAGMVEDTALYYPTLIGRKTLSQEDLWVRYWDGNTSLATGRKHTMGLLVDERVLGWNFPAGNNDIFYILVRFINITSNRLSDYAGLANFGYSAGDISDIYAIAQNYRATSQAFYNVVMPDSGFPWTNVFAAYAMDPDEGDASRNYAIGNEIFNTVINYKSDFFEPTWQLPPSIFSAPFAVAPGLLGIKYLAAPDTTGKTTRTPSPAIMGQTTNGGQFPDAVGVPRLWRNLSGNLLTSDAVSCDYAGTAGVTGSNTAQARHQCFWNTTPADTRMFSSTGPFTVNPGQAATIVVALVWAPSVASLPAATPGVNVSGNAQLPALNLTPFINTTNGLNSGNVAIEGRRLAVNNDTVKLIDRVAGFLNYSDKNADGVITQNEVATVPLSLLDKENVAQAIFNNQFLLPFAPDAPEFFVVPGDNQVTVAWQKSGSETTGNPFFTVASQPFIGGNPNSLYDPNFRKFDVEGYRVWRGRTTSSMTVVAQFDYQGTTIADYTAEFFDETIYSNQCAPELGIQTSCPTASKPYDTTFTHTTTFTTNTPVQINLVGLVRQIPPNGRVALANGTVFNTVVDTAVVGGGTGFPALTDNGVPFGWVDNGVVDGVRYFYAVTAFSINSLKSGPSSLESPLVTKSVTPRVGSGAEVPGTFAFTLTGRGTTALDRNAPVPTIDAGTGILSGPEPPANGASIGFAAFLPFTAGGSEAIQIDSILPSFDCAPLGGTCVNGTYFVTITRPDSVVKRQFSFLNEGTTGPSAQVVYFYPPVPLVTALAGRFGGDSTYALSAEAILQFPGAWDLVGQGRGAANGIGSRYNGPRWWAGTANEALSNPNGNVCATLSSGGCVDTTGNGNASAAGVAGGHINGVLPNIQYLWAPEGYQTVTNPMRNAEIMLASVARAADFKVYWGSTAGKVDSVIDVTHNVTVPYSKYIRAGWGILNDSSFTNTPAASTLDLNNNFLTFTDIFCVDPIPTYIGICGSVAQPQAAFLMDHALSNPMNFKAGSSDSTGGVNLVAQGATGNGFIFYLNGKFFVMQMQTTLAACCQNTVWNARFYAGHIGGSPGTFTFTQATRPPAVPGLHVALTFSGSTYNLSTSSDSLMQRIHTVPDPYYVTNSLEQTVNTKILRFVNLPAQAIIRIYSSSGILIRILSHNDAGGGGEEVWDLRNRNNQFVASGVYFYHVEGPDGKTKVGRFTVVNYAQ